MSNFYPGQKVFCKSEDCYATVIRIESKNAILILLHSDGIKDYSNDRIIVSPFDLKRENE